MYLNPSISTSLLAFGTFALGYTPADTSQTDALATQALKNLSAFITTKNTNGTCTLENAARRREWHALTSDERIAYSDAVLCLQSLPSRHNATLVPGAKSRYDDFVVIHMNQSLTIHGTANFLSWHRVFTALFETALREECGFNGTQPYWNWGKSALDPINSPIFDGSPGSMGGNGAFAPHNCTNAFQNNKNCIPAGAGGGCVTQGPFANMSVNLGPISPTLAAANVTALSPADFFRYNPRCLRRDVSVFVSSGWTTDQNSTDLIAGSTSVEEFQDTMQGNPSTGDFGVHGGGHFTIVGDPGGDFFISPGDPVFFLHHGQIDRTWWIWQNLDPETRTSQVAGTITTERNPPSRSGTLEDILDMGILAPPIKMAKAMSSVGLTGGPFCYVYE